MPIQVDAPLETASPTLGFSTLAEETVIDSLPVSGELPPWLSGSLLRTGPARFEVGERSMRHWFDGLAMLHRFTIDAGVVSYGNRFLESRAGAAAQAGQIGFREFATDPCRSLFKRVQSMFTPGSTFTDNCNVNIAVLGERYLAMTETPIAVQFDPDTLRAAGVAPAMAPGELSTAHPHLSREDGGMINYAAKIGPRCSYRFFTVDPDDADVRVVCSLPVREPAYMHSFGLTPRWLVLAEFPLVVNPLSLALAGRPFIENFTWKPELGTRFTLVDRTDGTTIGPFESGASFAFHHVNAFEHGGEVIVDVCEYADASIIDSLYLDRVRSDHTLPQAHMVRYRLDTAAVTATRTQLSDCDIELPRINYGRCNERPYRFAWGTGSGAGGWLERIVKIDTYDGTAIAHEQSGCYPGEPVFVACPGAEHEDDGVLLSVVLDAARATSHMLVLDACELTELARAEVPHHIPFGFHGQFMRTAR